MARGRYEALILDGLVPEALAAERRRLAQGIGKDEKICGMFVDSFLVDCDGNAQQVLDRARELMRIVNEHAMAAAWPQDDEWPRLLPTWFVRQCAPEQTHEEWEREEERLRALSWEERREHYRTSRWSLLSWTGWMDPRERMWIWWDADVRDADTLLVDIDRFGDPPPGEPPGFRWLFLASGARDLDEADAKESVVAFKR